MSYQQISYDMCRLYLEDLGHALTDELSSKVLGYLRARDLARLTTCTSLFDSHCHGVGVLRSLMQVEAFFKKNAVFSDSERCSRAAAESFDSAERKCRRTNRRLSWFYSKRERLAPDLRCYLEKVEAYIHSVLGPFEPFLEELPSLIKVTSGATATRSRRNSLPYLKVSKRLSCPARAMPYLRSLSRYFGYGDLSLRHSCVNRVEFVPKNWKTYRTIACEPGGALPLQLAFDTYCKRRLRRKGIDLSDQFRNQELARVGSIDGSLATIDLSAASDTLSKAVVAWFFPEPWYNFLDSVRSPLGKVGDKTLVYEKFSSMGNGSTFSIETLVFAACCYAVGSRAFSVYGDDIIIETELVQKLIALLSFLGFTVNSEKSYFSGSFRESCGSHYYAGTNVTPFYIRDDFRRKPDLCHVVNGLASVSVPGGKLWKFLLNLVEENHLPLVPYNCDSTSGIFVDTSTAYSLGLIRWKRVKLQRGSARSVGELVFKSYRSKDRTRLVQDSRTLFLWHLDASRSAMREIAIVRSRITITTHRYVRDWVSWVAPARVVPLHLYWWSELLVPTRG